MPGSRPACLGAAPKNEHLRVALIAAERVLVTEGLLEATSEPYESKSRPGTYISSGWRYI